MDRRNFLHKIGIGALALSYPLGASCGKGYTDKPNIVFILIDDLGWKDTGYMGSDFYETPNIDALSRTGIVFTNAYSSAPNCAPTRASLLTGMNPSRHGIYTVGSSERGRSENRKLIPVENKTILDTKFTTIPKILRQRGYVSAHMGKWHLGDDPENGPLAHGFDVNIGGNIAGHPKSYFSPYKNKNLSDGEKDEYLTDRLTGEALKFIDKNREKPFFLYLSHYAVHTPIQAKEEMTDKYRNKAPGKENDNPVYAAMIESVDDGVGKIVNKLQELELIDNTLIVFYSDNGGHGPTTSMEPLRGSKGMLYEGGIRVPLTVSWAGKIREDIKCDTPVTTTDMFPTFLDILSIDPSDHNMNLDGASLLPLLKEGGGFERDAIYWHFPAYLEAYRGAEGHWRTAPAGAVRAGKWKLIEFFETGRMELYNLEADIGENNDIADEYPDKVKELHDKLIKWREDTNAPVPTELNPDYTG